MTNTEFRDLLDAAILEGRGSGEIGKSFGLRSETVRRRRAELRRAGHHIPNIEGTNARRTRARSEHAIRNS